MKINRNILVFVLVLICLVAAFGMLYLLQKHQHDARQATREKSQAMSGTGSGVGKPNLTSGRPESPAEKVAHLTQLMKMEESPIDFYGRVVDENGRAIQGAEVDYVIRGVGTYADTPAPGSTQNGMLISDSLGSVNLLGKRGVGLTISTIKKEGYKSPPYVALSFTFNFRSSKRTSIENPALLMVVKNGIPGAYMVYEKTFKVSMAGLPFDLIVPDADITFHVIMNSYKRPSDRRDYRWSSSISMTGGKFQQIAGEIPSLAPIDGYVEKMEFSYPSLTERWQSGVRLQGVYRTDAGKYGNFSIQVAAEDATDVSLGAGRVFFNPSGNRNIN